MPPGGGACPPHRLTLQRHRQASLRDDARRLRPRDRRRAQPHHPPGARRRRLAHRAAPRGARRHPPSLSFSGNTVHWTVFLSLDPYTPELQPAEHFGPLVDEPVVNRHFDTLDQLEAILAEPCRFLKTTETSSPPTPTFIGGQRRTPPRDQPKLVSGPNT